MKIFFAPYQLQSLGRLNAKSPGGLREGTLLKVLGPYGIGYADLFPWPELGDAHLETHLSSLKTKSPTNLAQRSLALADKDARARDRRESLGLDRDLKNNALVTDVTDVTDSQIHRWIEQGFSTVKVKCGVDAAAEIELIERLVDLGGLKIRLDFNSGSRDYLQKFMNLFPSNFDSHLQYVEDPCVYDPEVWGRLRERWPLALDRETEKILSSGEKPVADVLILKPARQDVEPLMKWALRWNLSVTVTSSMDHPVGVVHAAVVGLELSRLHGNRILDAGCLTLDQYEANEFSKALPRRGPFVSVPIGFGIGFEKLLQETPWKEL